jgi:hypothetical protein
MMATAYRVGVVLHEDYKDKLLGLLARMPVWVVDTPGNREAAVKIWACRPGQSYLTGLTTFKITADGTATERCLGQLSAIDLHHGEYSVSPPYSELEVFFRSHGGCGGGLMRQASRDSGHEDGFIAYVRSRATNHWSERGWCRVDDFIVSGRQQMVNPPLPAHYRPFVSAPAFPSGQRQP